MNVFHPNQLSTRCEVGKFWLTVVLGVVVQTRWLNLAKFRRSWQAYRNEFFCKLPLIVWIFFFLSFTVWLCFHFHFQFGIQYHLLIISNFFNIFNYNHIDFHSNRDVDDVHDMMDDISEQTELANEISDAISTSVGFGQDYDEVSLNFFVFVFFLC